MKQWVKGLLAGSLAFALVACSGDSVDPETEPENPVEESSIQESSEPDTSSEVVVINGVEVGPLLKDYMEQMSSDNYYMKYQVDVTVGNEEVPNIETSFASRDGVAATETVTDMGRQNMVMEGDTIYMVLHDQEIVYVMDITSDEQEVEELEEPIDMEGFSFVESGTRDGLDYEVYESQELTATYYFDNGELVRMDMDSEEMQSTMEIIEFSDNPPAEMFEVPEDYEMINFGEMMEGLEGMMESTEESE